MHVIEDQTRQIRYTSDQFYKISKTFYITKFNYTIKILGIRQTSRTNRTDRRRKEEREEAQKMLEHGLQIREYAEAY